MIEDQGAGRADVNVSAETERRLGNAVFRIGDGLGLAVFHQRVDEFHGAARENRTADAAEQ